MPPINPPIGPVATQPAATPPPAPEATSVGSNASQTFRGNLEKKLPMLIHIIINAETLWPVGRSSHHYMTTPKKGFPQVLSVPFVMSRLCIISIGSKTS